MVKEKKRAAPRLRASCDRCHNAKVKCIYEEDHPDCVRCKRRLSICTRSNSLPVGRMPKTKTTTTESYPSPEQSQSPASPPEAQHAAGTPAASQSRKNSSAASSMGRTGDLMPPYQETILDFSQPAYGIPEFEPPPFLADNVAWFETVPPYADSPVPVLHSASPSSPASIETARPGDRRDSFVEADGRHCVFQPACTCFDVLSRTLRDLQQSPVEGKTLDHVLRLNRALMKVVRSVIGCCGGTAHAASLDATVYFCLNKLIATYHEALYMPCDSSVRFGSYTVTKEDRMALKCQIILLDIRKIMTILEELQGKIRIRDEDTVEADGDVVKSYYRRERQLLHYFTQNEAERVAKQIQLLWGG